MLSAATSEQNYTCNLISLSQGYIFFYIPNFISHWGEILYPGNGNDTFHSYHLPDWEDYRRRCEEFISIQQAISCHVTAITCSDSCYIWDPSIFAIRTAHLHCVRLMGTGLITTLLIYYVVSYLKTFSDQKDPLETHMLPLINSWTSKPWQKTAARKFLLFSQNLKWDLCCETTQISSLCSQGNYKTCSQIIWSEHSQLWSRHTNEGWASFPLSMGWTQTQQFFLDYYTA